MIEKMRQLGLLSWNSVKFISCVVVLTTLLSAMIVTLLMMPRYAHATTARIKDIVEVEGIRDNLLLGYGLVVGLNGTGDKLKNSIFTEKSLAAFLSRLGISTKGEELKVKNVAAVSITATLPPFARVGSRIDVKVTSLGDAKSLQGGVLLATPLMGADGDVYAVAQGSVAIEGFEAGGGTGSAITKGVPTNGFVASGGIIEREVAFDFNSLSTLNLALRNPDISTARQIADVINENIEGNIARAADPGTISVNVPEQYRDSVVRLLSKIEPLTVEPDQTAKIVVDEASGTVVMGENVRIDKVAVAQGNLVVRVTELPVISQPGAFAPEGTETVQATLTQTTVSEEGGTDKKLAMVESGASLRELVAGLNALGVGPRDMMSILQTIKVAGAMQAEIQAR